MSAQPHRHTGLIVGAPFTRLAAMEAGLTDADLARRPYARLFRGVYVHGSTARTVALRAAAALEVAPTAAVISHHTAALLWGGKVPADSRVHLTVPARRNCQIDGIRTHRLANVPTPILRKGIRVTSPERTVADLARYLDLVELVTLGDRLVRREVTSVAALTEFASTWRGPMAARFRQAISFIRPGVDSPPESRLRMLIVLAGLPEPIVNHVVRNANGEWVRRFELAYPGLRIAIEYSGRWHRENDEVWAADIERRDELDHNDWRVVEVLGKGLDVTPLQTLQRVESLRRDRGAAPTHLLDAWRPYFPGYAVWSDSDKSS